MSKYTRRLGASALITAAMLAACSKADNKVDSTALKTDSTLNRDLALANRDTAAQPQLTDVPATPAATQPKVNNPPARTNRPAQSGSTKRPADRPAPAPTTPAPTKTASGNTVTTNPSSGSNAGTSGGGAVGSIAAGTTLVSHANSKICTNTNAVGDHVTATIDDAVSGSNGATIPSGATLNMTVTALKRSENANDAIVMEFAVNSVSFGGHTYPIDGTVTSASIDRIRDQPKSKDVQKVAVGAVAGAIAGKILGKSTKGAVIGGAAGAAAGAAAASSTANNQCCNNSGSNISVKLKSPATIKA
jgi:hypothetical protein